MSCDCAVLKALTTPGLTHAESRIYSYYVGKARSHRTCWPSVQQIQDDLGIDSRATIASANKKLVTMGLISIKRRFHDTNHYEILDPDGLIYGRDAPSISPWTFSPDVQLTEHLEVQSTEHLPEVEIQSTERLSEVEIQSTEHLMVAEGQCKVQFAEQESTLQERKKEERKEERKTLHQSTAECNELTLASMRSTDRRSEFEAFYSEYPRKVGRGAAVKAFDAAIKRARGPGPIMAGLRSAQFSDDTKFIPHPTTWLNQDRWLDEPDRPRPGLLDSIMADFSIDPLTIDGQAEPAQRNLLT